ncbi:mannosyltransferase putative-domain-containing protein [Zopfochytrium polystomum]|nr:mannosyltransferase putative-domain-containing protein [Zopfochytrium polystomum]
MHSPLSPTTASPLSPLPSPSSLSSPPAAGPKKRFPRYHRLLVRFAPQLLHLGSPSSSSTSSSSSPSSLFPSSPSSSLAALLPAVLCVLARPRLALPLGLLVLLLPAILFLSRRPEPTWDASPVYSTLRLDPTPLDFAAKAHRDQWQAFVQNIPPYDPSTATAPRGVVVTGAASSIRNVVMIKMVLRKLGCDLPVAFAGTKNEVGDRYAKLLQLSFRTLVSEEHHNITLLDLTPYISAHNLTAHELALGAAKPFALLAAPFHEVLLLDPDVLPLVDPAALFDSAALAAHGALFWPDFMKRDPNGVLYSIFGVPEWIQTPSQEIESGQVVVDKRRAWRALQLAGHLASEAKYYFDLYYGDKESFYWAFAATGESFYMGPQYLAVVGTFASRTRPFGGAGPGEDDGDAPTYCGLSMLQYHVAEPGAAAVPAFMHYNGLKYAYNDAAPEWADVDPFAVAKTYAPPSGARVEDFDRVWYKWRGEVGRLSHCIDLEERDDLKQHRLIGQSAEAFKSDPLHSDSASMQTVRPPLAAVASLPTHFRFLRSNGNWYSKPLKATRALSKPQSSTVTDNDDDELTAAATSFRLGVSPALLDRVLSSR